MTKKVVGHMNGLVFCRLSVDICLDNHNDPDADPHVETADYMLPDSYEMMSDKQTKQLFCKLFGKTVELTINDMDRITDIKILENTKP
jgi:hypothetical protein